jgi:hypothetical protein
MYTWYVYGINPKRWAVKFGIEPITAPCQNCGKVAETTLPIVMGPYRGLAIDCPCGSHVPYCFVAANGDLFHAFDNLSH